MGGTEDSLRSLEMRKRKTAAFRPGDLVEYVPHMGVEFAGHNGLGLVVQVDLNYHPMAEVMWARFPEQGPVWFNVANLRVIGKV